jgi:hypothetical protein
MAHIKQHNLQFCPSLSSYLEPGWRCWYSDRTSVERLWRPNSLRFNGYRGSFPREGTFWRNDEHFVPSCQYIHVVFYVMYTQQTYKLFLGALAKLRKLLFASSCLSVFPSAWNNAAPTGRIFMKFYNVFFLNL